MKLLLALLLVASCAHIQSPDYVTEVNAPVELDVEVGELIEVVQPKPAPQPEPEPEPEVKIAKPEVKKVIVKVVSLTGFSAKQEERFKLIASRVEQVINSEEFKNGILKFTFNGKKQFVDTQHSNEEVLRTVLKSDWTLEYKLERMRSSTVGYTYPSVKWIAINKAKFDHMDDADIACNIVHEVSHKLGYTHAQKWSKPRDYTVPYGLGYLGERIYRAKFK